MEWLQTLAEEDVPKEEVHVFDNHVETVFQIPTFYAQSRWDACLAS
jgi:hypothetical protein